MKAALPYDLLGRAAYYAPLPMIAIDGEGRIGDFNVALRVLLEHELVVQHHHPSASILERIGFREFPLNGGGGWETSADAGFRSAAMIQAESRFESSEFGAVFLRCTAIKSHLLSRVALPEWIVYAEIVDMERASEYRAALTQERDRQLTWDEYAVSYDRILTEMPYYQDTISRHLQALSLPGIRTVADIGAGTGNLATVLLARGCEVTAVDPSRAMLGRLYTKVSEAGFDRLHVIEQNAERLPQLQDASFDGVNILLALFDMSDPHAALDEAIRILRPSGVLVVTEPREKFDLNQILQYCDARIRDLGRYPELASDLERVKRANKLLNPNTRPAHSPLRAELIRELLLSREFRHVTMTDSHFGNCATICGRKP